MNSEKRQKRQSLRIIASEVIMVIAVIAIVSVLALIVSGYWLNSDFTVERQGLLQVFSEPTGAEVLIDGKSSWMQRTNTSKVLSSGEHEVSLSKEGYDTWSKTINITEGLLYRLNYPRLFLKDRRPEKALNATNATFATISPDQNTLLVTNNTTEWQIVKIDNDTLSPKTIDISPYFSGVSLAEGATVGLFSGTILQADWDENNSHILFKISSSDVIEWVLLNVEKPTESINLTKEFGADFASIDIIDHSANTLLAVRNQNLHKIDVPSKAISSILVENIISYDHFENELFYIAKQSAAKTSETSEVSETTQTPNAPETPETNPPASYVYGLTKLGGSEIKELATTISPAKVAISKFYENEYLTTIQENQIVLHNKQNYDDITEYQLSFTPEHVKVGYHGEFILMWNGSQIASLDMELGQIREWRIENEHFGWLDNNMLYTMQDGDLIVYDFDGLNRRTLAKNVSGHFPAGITDNKWLYYFSDGELMREWIIEH
ncbi:PEGA domain-containing protein [Candidatus Saccharibacteria bacterium]|nr:PEGA domain-containing protein [Candidatus Saccharibacteria bacterium]